MLSISSINSIITETAFLLSPSFVTTQKDTKNETLITLMEKHLQRISITLHHLAKAYFVENGACGNYDDYMTHLKLIDTDRKVKVTGDVK